VPEGKVSPYVKAGVRQCITSGEIFAGNAAGIYGGAGVVLNHNRRVQFGLEAGFDSTTLKVHQLNTYYPYKIGATTKDVRPYKFTLSVFVSF
jgi:hypothetical protein